MVENTIYLQKLTPYSARPPVFPTTTKKLNKFLLKLFTPSHLLCFAIGLNKLLLKTFFRHHHHRHHHRDDDDDDDDDEDDHLAPLPPIPFVRHFFSEGSLVSRQNLQFTKNCHRHQHCYDEGGHKWHLAMCSVAHCNVQCAMSSVL